MYFLRTQEDLAWSSGKISGPFVVVRLIVLLTGLTALAVILLHLHLKSPHPTFSLYLTFFLWATAVCGFMYQKIVTIDFCKTIFQPFFALYK